MTTIDHLWQGCSYLWKNGNFHDIDNTLVSTKDFHPTSALLYITAPLSQFIESSGAIEGSAEQIVKRAEKAIEIAKKYDKGEWKIEELKQNLKQLGIREGDEKRSDVFNEDISFLLECACVYATALLYQALAEMATKSFVKGNYHLRASWKLFEKLEKESDSNKFVISERVYHSIHFGVGMILTMISSVPYKRLKALERAGFSSDMARGLTYLFENYEHNCLEAGLAALQIQLTCILLPTGFGNAEENLASVVKMSNDLCNAHPDSAIFAYNRAAILNKVGHYKNAILLMISFLDRKQSAKITSELAKSYMAYANFQKAAEFAEKAIRGGYNTIMTTFIHAAAIIPVSKNTEIATKILKTIPKPSALDQAGTHIYRRVKQINQGKGPALQFIPFEYLFFFRHINHLGTNEELQPQLTALLELLEQQCAQLADSSSENQACYYLYKGAILKQLKKEDASVYFEKIVEMQNKLKNLEAHLPMYANEELAEIRYAAKDLAKAEKHYKEITKLVDKDLPYGEVIQRRAQIALRQIKEITDKAADKAKSPKDLKASIKEDKKKDEKKQTLAERCALNRGTSFIAHVESKVAVDNELKKKLGSP